MIFPYLQPQINEVALIVKSTFVLIDCTIYSTPEIRFNDLAIVRSHPFNFTCFYFYIKESYQCI